MNSSGRSSKAKMQPENSQQRTYYVHTPFLVHDSPKAQNSISPCNSKSLPNDAFSNSTLSSPLPSKNGQFQPFRRTDGSASLNKTIRKETYSNIGHSTLKCVCPERDVKPTFFPHPVINFCDYDEQHLKGLNHVKCMLKTARLYDFPDDLLDTFVEIHKLSWITTLMLENRKIQKALNLPDEIYLLSLSATIKLADLMLADLDQDSRVNVVRFVAGFTEDAKHILRIKTRKNLLFLCKACNVTLNPQDLESHFTGSKHHAKGMEAGIFTNRARQESIRNVASNIGSFSSRSGDSLGKPVISESSDRMRVSSNQSKIESQIFEPSAVKSATLPTKVTSDILSQFKTVNSPPNSAFCLACQTKVPGPVAVSNNNLIEHVYGARHRQKLASVNASVNGSVDSQRSQHQSSDSSKRMNGSENTSTNKTSESPSRELVSSSEDFTELMNSVMKKHIAGEVPLNYDSKNIGILGYYCEICKKVILTDLDWLHHLDDLRHNMNVVKASQKTCLYHCLVCKIVIFCPLVMKATSHSHISSYQHNYVKKLVEKRFSPISVYVQIHKVLTIEADGMSCNSYSMNLAEKFTLPENEDSGSFSKKVKSERMSSEILRNSPTAFGKSGHSSRISTRDNAEKVEGRSPNLKSKKGDKRIEFLEESDSDESSDSDDYEHLPALTYPESDDEDSADDYSDDDDVSVDDNSIDDDNLNDDDTDNGSDDDDDDDEDDDDDDDDDDGDNSEASETEVSALMKDLKRALSIMGTGKALHEAADDVSTVHQSVRSNVKNAADKKNQNEGTKKATPSVEQSRAKKGKEPRARREKKGFEVSFSGIDSVVPFGEWVKRFSEAGKIKEIHVDLPSGTAKVTYFKKSALRKIFGAPKDSILKKYKLTAVETEKKNLDQQCLNLFENEHEFMNKVSSTLRTLDHELNAPESRLKLSTLNESVLHAVQLIYPVCKIYEFGSRVSGLATAESDYDLFLDLTGTMYQGSSQEQDQESRHEMVMHIRKIASIFRQMPREFTSVVPITSARVPILKFKHVKTRSQCDLSFKNGLSVENTKLVRKYLGMNPKVVWLVIGVKTWANTCGLLSSSHFTTYALTWLVLFFLMTKKLVPTVGSLMKLKKKGNKIQGWRCSFDDKNTQLEFKESNIQLLLEFFHHYERYDFWKSVICTRSGTSIRKFIFSDHVTHMFPNDIKDDYLNHVARLGKEREFNVGCCSVQDPFDLSHNITRQVRPGILKYFQRCCSLAAAQIYTWPPFQV